MSGRKKRGDLQKPIGVRLDQPILDMVELIAKKSGRAEGADRGTVIRTIVTDWLYQRPDLLDAFNRVADRVHAIRSSFEVGESVGSVERARRRAPKGTRG